MNSTKTSKKREKIEKNIELFLHAPIQYINHSIAYTVEKDGEKYIQLNKRLLDYPKLKIEVLKHEQGHLKRKGILSNILYDLTDFSFFKNKEMWKFCLKEPSVWKSLWPCFTEKGETIYNLTSVFYWLLVFAAFCFAVLWNIMY